MTEVVGVVTGGRKHWLTLAELECFTTEARKRGVTTVRDGDARGVDRTVRGYVRSRNLFATDKWPADWTTHKLAAGPIRNRAMLDGDPPDLLGNRERGPAKYLFAFAGGEGTADCRQAAKQRGLEVVDIAPVREPRIWNMHARWSEDQERPPGLIYVGRSKQHGGPSPLANQCRIGADETRTSEVERRVLGGYREWLWQAIQAGDRAVLAALDSISAESFLGCTCWPMQCHAEIIVRAWRWRNKQRKQA